MRTLHPSLWSAATRRVSSPWPCVATVEETWYQRQKERVAGTANVKTKMMRQILRTIAPSTNRLNLLVLVRMLPPLPLQVTLTTRMT